MKTRFLQFIFDSDTRQLLSDGAEVHLSRKAFDLLGILLTHRPNVVAKDELLRQIWTGSFVSEANLNVLIGEIRTATGDNAKKPRVIRTAHGVGYAFCASATDLDAVLPADRGDRTGYWLIGSNREFVLAEGDNIIGRDPSCDVWLNDPDVSRRHARIHIDRANQDVLIEDLGSTNGTLLSRARITSPTTLEDGDVISVGPVYLTFRNSNGRPQETRRIRRKGRPGRK